MIKKQKVKLTMVDMSIAKDFARKKAGIHLKKIGYGCYASVYASKKSKTVYKIGMCDSNRRGYLSYVEAIIKLKTHNPYTPVIYNYWELWAPGSESVFVIEMERLKELPERYAGEIADELKRLVYKEKDETVALNMIGIDLPKTIVQVKNIIVKLVDGRSSNDIHSGNIMRRGKQIVITDPVC